MALHRRQTIETRPTFKGRGFFLPSSFFESSLRTTWKGSQNKHKNTEAWGSPAEGVGQRQICGHPVRRTQGPGPPDPMDWVQQPRRLEKPSNHEWSNELLFNYLAGNLGTNGSLRNGRVPKVRWSNKIMFFSGNQLLFSEGTLASNMTNSSSCLVGECGDSLAPG